MSTPALSHKRKADALEADGEGTNTRKSAPDDSPACLPATCLAAVLNFMWYTDVRQCMLAGKMMAVEAARHVETLNITKASELVVPAARRFGNASELNVLCLVSPIDEEHTRFQMSKDTVTRIVPFLSSIPNLERAYLGGLMRRTSNGEAIWGPIIISAPRRFKTLIQNFIGGFESKSLPRSLELSGILYQRVCAGNGREDPDHPCQSCRRILSSFPLRSLLRPISLDSALCVSRVDCIRAILRRDEGEAALRSNDGAGILLSCLRYEISPMETTLNIGMLKRLEKMKRSSKNQNISKSESGVGVVRAFIKKMREQGAACYPGSIQLYFPYENTLSESLKDFLDHVKSSSLLQNAINGIPRSRLLETFKLIPEVGKTVFVRHVFEALLEAGLQLDASDYIIVEEKEPALAHSMWPAHGR